MSVDISALLGREGRIRVIEIHEIRIMCHLYYKAPILYSKRNEHFFDSTGGRWTRKGGDVLIKMRNLRRVVEIRIIVCSQLYAIFSVTYCGFAH